MIIKEVKLINFGIYGGEHKFRLMPTPQDGFNRPIILFKGKNGAGKTTFTEALRLCLHGSLALGSRVSRAEYETHLANRLHRPEEGDQANSATISLLMDYIDAGRRFTYKIERTWEQVNSKIKENISIIENEKKLLELKNTAQQESFLRELVPPRIADIFFFDGEKLETLLSDDAAAALLRDTVETLFGLHLVHQLQKDLDFYLTRQPASQNSESIREQLTLLTQQEEALTQQDETIDAEIEAVKQEIAHLTQQTVSQKQKIASEGGLFAERLNETEARRQRLEAEIELLRRQAQEMANGLMPFAIAPHMNQLVAQRLHLEQEYEQAVSAQQVIKRNLKQITAELSEPDYWTQLDLAMDSVTHQKLLAKLETTIKQTAQPPDIDPDEIMLRFSDQDRQTLLNWIDRAADDIPRQFCRLVTHLNALEKEQKRLEQELELVPADETLQPLVEALHQYLHRQTELQNRLARLQEEKEQIGSRIQQNEWDLKRVREQLREHEQHNQQVNLAIQSHEVLEIYVRKLRIRKVRLLEEALVNRFNQLCRKEDLLSSVTIDPQTFKITLLRRGQTFERKQLSAGEKQLLATATIWALREVSQAPLPVVLDTPLGRLDSDHRLNMLDYFPQASHQVILLATDTEIDAELENRLRPVISYKYDLNDPDLSTKPGKAEAVGQQPNGRVIQPVLIGEEADAYEFE